MVFHGVSGKGNCMLKREKQNVPKEFSQLQSILRLDSDVIMTDIRDSNCGGSQTSTREKWNLQWQIKLRETKWLFWMSMDSPQYGWTKGTEKGRSQRERAEKESKRIEGSQRVVWHSRLLLQTWKSPHRSLVCVCARIIALTKWKLFPLMVQVGLYFLRFKSNLIPQSSWKNWNKVLLVVNDYIHILNWMRPNT